MALYMRVALGLAVCWICVSSVVGQESAAKSKMQIEIRWANDTPTKGLTEDKGIDLSCSKKKAYLHKKAVLVNADVARTRLLKANAAPGNKYFIDAFLTEEAAKRMAQSSKDNLKKPLVVLVDGKVVAAMVVMEPLTDFVPITGYFSEAEGERIINGIK